MVSTTTGSAVDSSILYDVEDVCEGLMEALSIYLKYVANYLAERIIKQG